MVYHANYLKFMGRARNKWLRNLGFDRIVSMHEWNIAFVIEKGCSGSSTTRPFKEHSGSWRHTAKFRTGKLEFRSKNQFHDR